MSRPIAQHTASPPAAYWWCAEILLLAVELPFAQLPATRELRQRIIALLDGMVMNARSAGVADADIAEARYALVAFIDEQIAKSSWAGRTEWMNEPLQLLLYGDFKAGEMFFSRMHALLRDGRRPLAVEIYYLCLTLGFRGAYGSGSEGALAPLGEGARQQLGRLYPAATISPNARPVDRAAPERHSRTPFIVAVLACAGIALLILVALQWSLVSSTNDVVERMPRPAATSPSL